MNIDKYRFVLHPAFGAVNRSQIGESIHEYALSTSKTWSNLEENAQGELFDGFLSEIMSWSDSIGVVESEWSSPGYKSEDSLVRSAGLPTSGKFNWSIDSFKFLNDLNIAYFRIQCSNQFELYCHDSWDNVYCNLPDVLPVEFRTDTWLKQQISKR